MAKGFFTQGVCLLTNGQTTIDDIRSALRQQRFEIVKERPAREEDWALGGPTLVVAFLPEVNGYAAVDVVNRPWPDSMGDPKSDSMTFAAWSMGHFGPLAFPGSLARSRQHAWAWRPARTISEGHRGFIRLRISYVFGGNKNTPVMPADYDPVAEMMFLSRAVIALLRVPGVICYFNPNGEVLRDYESFREVWDACTEQQKLPLPLWMNIRFFNLGETLGFMDTVGNGQLETRDVEAAFPSAGYDPGDVDYYLRNVTHYLLDFDGEMQSGEEIDGPGETNLSWTMEVLDQGVVQPPRRVLRLYPKVSSKAVRQALSVLGRSG
jgi:hypothetical protein